MQRSALYSGASLEQPDDHPQHLAEALPRAAQRFPDAGVLTVSEQGAAEFVSYPMLLDRARRLLGALRQQGVRAGDHVVLYASHPAHFFASFWACALGGISPLLVARPSDPAASAGAADRLRRAARVVGEPLVLCDRPGGADLPDQLRCLDVTTSAGHPPVTELHRAAPDDVAMLMMSSGSTGDPKIIQLTQRGLSEFAAGTPTLLPVRPGDTTLNWLPLDHSGAFLLYHLFEVFVGCTNVHVPTESILADPLRWLDLIAEHQVNHTWSPNFGYQMVNQALAEQPERQWNLSSVSTLVSGGEQITVPVMTQFLRRTAPFGVRPEAFVPAWGMTETVTAITFARPGLTANVHRIRKASLEADLEQAEETDDPNDSVTFVAVGSPAPGATLRVVDDAGNVLPERRIGRLEVSSARVTAGYLNNPAADRAAFVAGDGATGRWLNTGDLAFGADGQIVIVGREGDRIILNGQNHYTHEIEAIVAAVPGVDPAYVAACGVPDGATGTEALVVFLGTDAVEPEGTIRAIRQALYTRLRTAGRVVAMSPAVFPKTNGGKIRRSVLRRRFLDGEFDTDPAPIADTDPAPVADTDPARVAAVGASAGLADSVRAVFQAVLRADVDQHTPFYELGIESVTLVRLHARLERDLGLRFSKLAMLEHPSVAALTDYLGSLGAAAERRPVAEVAPDATQRIAIVGMAVRLPGADTLAQFWANLTQGVVSVRRFSADELASAGVSAADRARTDFVPVTGALADIDAFDAEFFGMSAAEAERTDPAHRLFLECCYHALEHGGYAGRTGTRRIGVFAGSGMNLYTHQSYLLNNLLGADRSPDPITAMQTAIGNQPDFLASLVAYRLGLTGPAVGVQTACSTSLVALHLACQAIRTGDADLALAGAAAIHVPQVTGYRAYPGSILSPSGECRAFDAGADGTVGGNGVAAVLLKRLDRALEDGDTIHAVILGSAVNNDGAGKVGFTAPSVSGQVDVIERALDRAGVPAETISYLEAHGTGTRLGDPVELRAAARALRNRTDEVGFCTVGSVKPNIGHLDSCAGMAGLVKTVLMLSHRTLVPLANWRRPNPELELSGSPFVLGTDLRPWRTDGAPRRAGVTALGVGGTNAHVILEEAPAVPEPEPQPGTLRVLPLSAAHPAALAELTGRMREHLAAQPRLPVADLIATAALGRPHHRYRLAVVGETAAELADALGRAPTGEAPPDGSALVTFAFTGQGAGRPKPFAELHAAFPAFRRVLDECERVYAEERGGSLLAVLGPDAEPSAWATDIAQPALFAFQVGLAELWRTFGIEPDFVLGHSLGVLPALCVAGGISVADGVRLATLRGELMRREAPPGAMIALLADRTTVDKVSGATGVETAAVNGPEEYVLTGPKEAIRRATTWLDEAGVGWRRLPVDRAFHSASMDPVVDAFAARVSAVPIAPLSTPMACTVTGRLLPAGTVLDSGYLTRQIRQPVRFADAVRLVLAEGSRRFLEIGPDALLSGTGRRTAPDSDWVPAQRRDTDPVRATESALAELYRLGVTVDWTAVAGAGRRRPLPSYPFRRSRHWIGGGTSQSVDGDAEARPLDGDAAVRPPDGVPKPAGEETAPEPAAPGTPDADILTRVREQTARQLGTTAAAVRPDSTFLHLGADSLAMLRVVQEVRRSFGIELSARELFTSADTPERLTALIVARMAAAGTSAAAPERPATREPATGPTEPAAVEVSRVASPAAVAPGTDDGPTSSAAVMAVRECSPDGAAPGGGAGADTSTPARRICDFSLYFFGDYPDQDRRDKYAPLLDAARFADRHGFHAVWLPERHFHSFGGLFPNPVVLAAALARETSRIRINAGSVVLPLHHPIRVAEEWSVVDNLSDGRVGLCVASGWHANDFALNPDAFGQHRDLMYEHLETVRALWSGASVPARSGSGEQIDVRIFPRPLQAMPPMFVAAVSNPETYRAAAARDLGVVTNLMMQSIEQLADNIALYRRTRREHGLDPEAGRVVVLVHTYLGDDLRQARADAFAPFCDYLRSSLSLLGGVTNSLGLKIDDSTPAEDVDFMLGQAYARYCEGRALIGTIETSIPIVERLAAAGADEIACFVDFGLPADQMLESLRLVADARLRHQQPDPAPAYDHRSGPAHDHQVAPLAAAQRGMWFLEHLNPGRTNYHEPKAVKLRGPLDVTALRWAVHRVVERHAPLRTVFRTIDGEPRQVVLPSVEVDCPVVDLPGTPDGDAIRQAVRECATEGIDLATGPLLRLRLLRLGVDEHVLVLYAHHIVFDSFSTAVFVRDLAALYRCWPTPDQALPPLTLSYPEHVRARLLGAEERSRHRDFWRSALAGAPPLRLPTDRPRPPVPTASGAALLHHLDATLTAAIREFSRAHRVTPFMTMLAAVATVLGRFSDQQDIVLGTVLANRPAGTEDLIGLFIDSVPLRIDLSGAATLGDLVQRVRDTSTEAFEHAGIGFDEMVDAVNPERDPSRNPLFQVMVEYENAATVDFDPPRIDATLLDVPTDRAPLDLTLYLTAHPDRVQCVVEYNTDLFDENTVRRLLDYLDAVLARACAAPGLDLPALTVPIDADLVMLDRWGGAYRDDPAGSLPELVEAQVARTPTATALLTGDLRLSYRELDRRANALAWRLRDRGVRPDEFVAVCLPRGVDLVVALLAVHKAGAAYLPLDPGVPEPRLAFMVRDSGALLLVTEDGGLADRLGVPALPVGGDDPRAADAPPRLTGPDNLAYAIYTSGSTGRPKGVSVPHRGPANLIRSYLRRRPALHTLQWTSVGFDVSVQEIFTTLASGAALVLLADEARHDPEAVVETIRRHRVERLFMPFTPLKYLLETGPAMPSLREIVSAGEELTLTPALRRFLAAHPDCALYNEYGPTEASIIATIHPVRPDGDLRPPIGRPVDNVVVRLLDERRLPVPVGAPGEIYLGGAGLARGYVGRPEETALAFVADPVTPGARLYRTGDLARWLPDGSLRYLGRIDDQVKIRGHRVEIGETQRALYALDEVRDAAVLARRDARDETYLAAYVVLAEEAADGFAARLADRLGTTLPGYLIPSRWVRVDELPVSASGKLDRTRLPEPERTEPSGAAPETDLERVLHELWASQLGLAEVPVDASFFSLGGHSLTGVELVSRIRQALGVEVRVADLFHAPTIRAMARRVGPAVPPATSDASDRLPAHPAELAPHPAELPAHPVVAEAKDAAPPASLSDTVAATSFQQRGWRLHHATAHPEVYNVAHRIQLDGDLDPSALRRALGALVRRHAALRTRFALRDGELVQEVLADQGVQLPVIDLSAEPDGGAEWCRAAAGEPVSLTEAPLWRVRLGRLGGRRWVLMLVLHHLICDGWSMGVIWRELSALYTDEVAGTTTGLPIPVQFPEYARWRAAQLAGERRDALLSFWRTELNGAPLRVDLPYDRPRSGELSGRGALHRFAVPEPTVRLVHAVARDLACTPAAVLTAAFAVWLAELCGQRDVVLPLSSASRVRPEHGGVVGPVGEALLVRITLTDTLRFDELVHAVTQRTFAALDHHALPLAQVAAAVGTDMPTPQLLFTVVTTPPPILRWPNLSAEVQGLAVAGVARTELYVVLRPDEETIDGVFEYSTDLFDGPTVKDWAAGFVAALDRMASAPRGTIRPGPGRG